MPSSRSSLCRRHLREHALLELQPQPRHADEHRRPGALQVLQEGVQRLGEEHVRLAVDQRRGLDPRALEAVRQRQVRQDAAVARVRPMRLCRSSTMPLAGARDGAEADHRALGPAGGAGGVDDHRQLVLGALRPAGQRLGARDDRRPSLRSPCARCRAPAGRRCAAARRRTPGFCASQVSSLPTNSRLASLWPEHVADGLGGLGGEDRHRGVAGHPDGQLGHDEVGAVLRQDGDARAAREAAALQVRGHAPRLVQHLAPRCSRPRGPAERLGQVDAVGRARPRGRAHGRGSFGGCSSHKASPCAGGAATGVCPWDASAPSPPR